MEIVWGGLANNMPSNVWVTTSKGALVNVPISWNTSILNRFRRGLYKLEGDLGKIAGLFNSYGIKGKVEVTVLPKPAPLDLILSNNIFKAAKANQEVAIGSLKVVDPVDNRHVLELPLGLSDNKYFRLINDVIYWSSTDPVAGRTSFKIVVRVTDRDGNILDKLLEITRTRPSIADIVIYNTFTPNGDGVNDTWGVPDIRSYLGARVQVFERSGVRVFYTEDPDVRWDGTYKGKEVPVGTYYWVIEIKENLGTRRGLLNLLRK